VTLNDPVYHQAAEALAARMARDVPQGSKGDLLNARLNNGGRLVLSRDLSDAEVATLRRLYGHFANSKDGFIAVASALLNLDAALTR